MVNPVNITSKDILISRMKKSVSEEKRLVGKIITQIKQARKKPGLQLNIDEKQLRAHLNEELKKWAARKVPQIIDKFLAEIKTSLKQKEQVLLRGYFSLKVRRSAARKVRNPQTGQPLLVPAKNNLSFRTGSKLKREIN